jgi:hypothetical protein
MVQYMKGHFFQPQLQTGRDVSFAIGKRGARVARWSKKPCELVTVNFTDNR